jgi:hypothetical protein
MIKPGESGARLLFRSTLSHHDYIRFADAHQECFTCTVSPASEAPASSARKRTRPLATERPSASVSVASQTCVRRPRIKGRAVARSFPSRTAFRNDVWFSRPTTDWLRGSAANAAPTEAIVSISRNARRRERFRKPGDDRR